MTETRLALLDEQITKINKLIKYSKKYLNCKPVKEEVESFISKLEEISASLKDQFKSEYQEMLDFSDFLSSVDY